MLHDLFFQRSTVVASFAVGFERLTQRRLTYVPGNVKLWEFPGKVGGLPVIIIDRVIERNRLFSVILILQEKLW